MRALFLSHIDENCDSQFDIAENDTLNGIRNAISPDCRTISPAFTYDLPDTNLAITGYADEDGLGAYPVGLCVFLRDGEWSFENVWCGPVVIVGLDNSTGKTVGLTDEMIKMIHVGPRKLQRVQGILVSARTIWLDDEGVSVDD